MADRVSTILPIPPSAVRVDDRVIAYTRGFERLGCDYEILLVIDESAGRAVHEIGGVRTLSIRDWRWGKAVRAGLSQANGNILCFANLDRTSAETLTLMTTYALTYKDVVLKAHRRTRDSVLQRVGSLLYNLEVRSLFKLTDWDVNGTPKLFPRTYERLRHLTRDDELLDVEFLVICKREGYSVLEVPITALPVYADWPRTSIATALRMYLAALRMARRREYRT
jgi:hypothetical protein